MHHVMLSNLIDDIRTQPDQPLYVGYTTSLPIPNTQSSLRVVATGRPYMIPLILGVQTAGFQRIEEGSLVAKVVYL
jgi:hypothetical protein